MATSWNQSKRSRSWVAPRSRVTSANVSRPGLLFGMSEPPSKYWTFATSTESSLHFWKPAWPTSSISTMNLNFLWKLRGLPMTVMG